jgi:D-glycero-alpha-D-manno-heptose 1-phosphate guanylyltransferase
MMSKSISDPSPTLSQVTALILAGGLGTRLRSRIADRPKVLAPVLDKPFLSYLLDRLQISGIQKVILCIGYLGEQIKETYGQSYHNLELFYSQETTLLGTGGALRLALPLISSPVILMLNGDSFYDVNLKDFYQWHLKRDSAASLALTQVSDTARYGRVQLNEISQITHFEEKGNTSGAGWINAGIYLIKRHLLTEIPENQVVSLERELFPNWIERGLYGYPTQGQFIDIGTPESYALAEQFFSKSPQ